MRVQFDNKFPESVLKNLSKNELELQFFLVQMGLQSCEARHNLLKEKSISLSNLVLKQRPPNTDTGKEIIEIQTQQFDLISSIFMFLEEYLVYSNNLRTSLSDFHVSIASRNDTSANNELSHLEGFTNPADFSKYLLIDKMLEGDTLGNDKNFIRQKMAEFANDISKRIRNLIKFHHQYNRVYIKFKHTLPAIIGLYDKEYQGIITDGLHGVSKQARITSFIFIRDYNKRKINTFVLPLGMPQLVYFQEIIDDIYKIFNTVLIVYLNSMANSNKDFLVPISDYLNEEEFVRWTQILAKTNIRK